MLKQIAVIGSGFSGLSSASILAKQGFDVTIYEKNEMPGGRARQYHEQGFTFDMGPSWYWMPDVVEKYFSLFDSSTADYFELKRLEPSYRIFWGEGDNNDIPASEGELYNFFESVESGSSKYLKKFLKEAAYKYRVGIDDLVYKSGLSINDYLDKRLLLGAFKLHVFKSHAKYVRKFFKNEKLIRLLEFPVLFLGAMPDKIPALYSLMNYADLKLGTWYPMGGMYKLVEAMTTIAKKSGVEIKLNSAVEKICVNKEARTELFFESHYKNFDAIIGSADYHHIESQLLPDGFQNYNKKYWDKRTLAPSCMIFYLGISKKVEGLKHHNLFFDESFEQHAKELYRDIKWPSKPLFYVCCPSKTDPSVAPEGKENLFILIPVAPGLVDSPSIRDSYREVVIKRLEKLLGNSLESSIEYERSYALQTSFLIIMHLREMHMDWQIHYGKPEFSSHH